MPAGHLSPPAGAQELWRNRAAPRQADPGAARAGTETQLPYGTYLSNAASRRRRDGSQIEVEVASVVTQLTLSVITAGGGTGSRPFRRDLRSFTAPSRAGRTRLCRGRCVRA